MWDRTEGLQFPVLAAGVLEGTIRTPGTQEWCARGDGGGRGEKGEDFRGTWGASGIGHISPELLLRM